MPQPAEDAPIALIVDDDERYRMRLAKALGARGWQASEADDLAGAEAAVHRMRPDLAIIDLRLERASGLHVVARLREIEPEMTVLMLTGYGSIATAVAAMRAGATDYLTKPVDADQILAAYARLRGPAAAAPAPASVPGLDQVAWEHIQRVLNDCGGNISQAARLLGVHRRSLQRKLAKRPLPPAPDEAGRA